VTSTRFIPPSEDQDRMTKNYVIIRQRIQSDWKDSRLETVSEKKREEETCDRNAVWFFPVQFRRMSHEIAIIVLDTMSKNFAFCLR
jgi:hypothetical protein